MWFKRESEHHEIYELWHPINAQIDVVPIPIGCVQVFKNGTAAYWFEVGEVGKPAKDMNAAMLAIEERAYPTTPEPDMSKEKFLALNKRFVDIEGAPDPVQVSLDAVKSTMSSVQRFMVRNYMNRLLSAFGQMTNNREHTGMEMSSTVRRELVADGWDLLSCLEDA